MFNLSTEKALASALSTPATDAVKASSDYRPLSGLLLPYQERWLADDSSVMMAVKGRRTGLTWGDSLKSVLDGIKGLSTFYTSYNQETTANYIRYCVKWAKALNAVATLQKTPQIINDKEILVYRLRFTSGGQIVSLAGNATNLRDKSGKIVIDEAAFRDNLEAILDAALAILIWGGQVRFISTLNGTDNRFTELWRQVQAGRLKYSLHYIPFMAAVKEGLFHKICLVKGETYTPESEKDWVESIYSLYGSGASQELDCIPAEDSGNGIFEASWFIPSSDYSNIIFSVRAWDLAATESDGCYSVGVLMGLTDTDQIVIMDAIWGQYDPTTGDEIIRETARADGIETPVIIEQEPGSESIRWATYLESSLGGYTVEFVKPVGGKLSRAIPLANAVKSGRCLLGYRGRCNMIPDQASKFNGKKKELVNDVVDALSLGYNYLQRFVENTMLGT